MTPTFSLRATPRFEREYRKLFGKHPELADLRSRLAETLSTDPYNRQRLYHIRKLVDVDQGTWRPRVHLDSLGLGYEAMAASNERLIYASVTPYGQAGPKAHWAGGSPGRSGQASPAPPRAAWRVVQS